jgi:kynureninase
MFSSGLEYAQRMDQEDTLRSFRERFLIPQHQGRPVMYFTGNSLGLQPRGVKEAMAEECDDWARWGVEGHFHARHPWYSYHETLTEGAALIAGALPEEVVMMNQLTVNLHLLMASFYRPRGKRRKILFEHKPFPSDHYAFASQASWHGLQPEDVLIELKPRAGEYLLREEDILQAISDAGEELALVCIGGVNYFTGQLFPMKSIVQAAHAVGAMCGFDLAHAAGNVPLALHDWEVDFACWCTYKYLNSGPGAVGGVFVHKKHTSNPHLHRLAGWWGHDKATRFKMEPDFVPIPTAESWQMSNAPVFNMIAHRISLGIFQEAGMAALRRKSILLTGYLEYMLKEVEKNTGQSLHILSPTDPEQRGCQLSVVVKGKDRTFIPLLAEKGIVADWREPDVIRLAPVPLYNSFEDVYRLKEVLEHLFSQQ